MLKSTFLEFYRKTSNLADQSSLRRWQLYYFRLICLVLISMDKEARRTTPTPAKIHTQSGSLSDHQPYRYLCPTLLLSPCMRLRGNINTSRCSSEMEKQPSIEHTQNDHSHRSPQSMGCLRQNRLRLHSHLQRLLLANHPRRRTRIFRILDTAERVGFFHASIAGSFRLHNSMVVVWILACLW